jgi:hypothetical protein
MEKQAAEIILEYGGELHEDYSGRNMNGKETTGIVFEDDLEFLSVIGDLMIGADEIDCEVVGKELKKLRTDNMGKGVIYY